MKKNKQNKTKINNILLRQNHLLNIYKSKQKRLHKAIEEMKKENQKPQLSL